MMNSDVKLIKGTQIPIAKHVTGAHYAATAIGFTTMMIEANIAESEGYRLINVVRLEKTIAVLYRRSGPGGPTQFFEPEDAPEGGPDDM